MMQEKKEREMEEQGKKTGTSDGHGGNTAGANNNSQRDGVKKEGK